MAAGFGVRAWGGRANLGGCGSIVAEGQQQWVKEEISRKIGAPERLFAAGDWGPMALPQACDGGEFARTEYMNGD